MIVETRTDEESVPSSLRRTLALRIAVGLGIGALLVIVFLQLVNFHSVATRLEHLNIAIALLCGAVFLGAYAVRALRWRWFLLPDKISAPRAIGIYYIAIFLNWALPIQGGELAKSVILRRSDGIPVSRSLATVTLDKAMDLVPAVVLLTIVPLSAMHLSGALWVLLVFALVVLGVAIFGIGFATWQRDRTLAMLTRVLRVVLPRRLVDRIEPFVAEFLDTLLALTRRPRVLVIALVYTAIAVSLDALFCYLAFVAVGVSLSWTTVLFGYTFYNLAYIMPTPPAHLGSNELVGLLIFSGLFGVNRSDVGAMFLFSHPWTGLLMTTTALCCIRAIGLNFRTVLGLRARASVEAAE